MKCFEAQSKISCLHDEGSTGGVASTLAYFLLQKKIVKGVLVSKRYKTFIAYSLEDLLKSQGSIYEYFPYTTPSIANGLAQIGKPCDIDLRFKIKISLFCSSIYSNIEHPITKDKLASESSFSRYFRGLKCKPFKCRHCIDHVGTRADFSVGDSQYNKKLNNVLVRNVEASKIWCQTINQGFVWAKEINYEKVKQNQPFLFEQFGIVKSFISKYCGGNLV